MEGPFQSVIQGAAAVSSGEESAEQEFRSQMSMVRLLSCGGVLTGVLMVQTNPGLQTL